MNHDADSNANAAPPSAYRVDIGAERLARVYAEALFAAAGDQAATVIQEMDSLIDDVFASDPRLESVLGGAAVGREARRLALERAFGGRSSDAFYRFLMVVNTHERLDLVRPIRQALHDIDDERRHRIKVHVFTAIPLPGDYEARIADAVRQRFGLEPVLVPHVDPSLLGGLKIRIGDQQVDATVRNRLDNLRNQVIARSSHEIQSRRNQFRTD
jgi:F-type H+-transporting ATPase subunit delta